MASTHVCEVCGLPVRLWNFGWKHSGGGRSLSCGRPPRPMLRTDYEAYLKGVVEAVKRRL